MYEVKTIEIRDSATFIPAIAIKLEHAVVNPLQVNPEERERERYLLSRSGFGMTPRDHARFVLLVSLTSYKAAYDPYEWGTTARTMYFAHQHLIDNWEDVESGGVVDVQFLLDETSEPKQSERITSPY